MWAAASRRAPRATFDRHRNGRCSPWRRRVPRESSSCLTLLRIVFGSRLVATQSRQRLADLDLESARRGPIVTAIRKLVGMIAFAFHVRIRRVVRVFVSFAVA